MDFKKKIGSNGGIENYKERLVTNGYSEVEGIGYGEIFSTLMKIKAIIFFLSTADAYNLKVEQMDVKTTSLHDDFQEEIHMTCSKSIT